MGVSPTWNRTGRRNSEAKVLQPVRVAGADSISEAQHGLGSAPKRFLPPVPGTSSVPSWGHNRYRVRQVPERKSHSLSPLGVHGLSENTENETCCQGV